MTPRTLLPLLAALLLLAPALSRAQTNLELGFGAHYWRVIDDIDVEDFDDDGLAYAVALRVDGGLLALQGEVEFFPENYGGATERVYAPQALVILGDGIYVGVGIGGFYTDGEFSDKPFYLLRAGLAIAAFGPVTLDLYANYYFSDFNELEGSDIDTDTISLGAMLRLQL
jgi:hypothetical protein